MHHSVRKAKHFKLNYDEEIGYYVDDEFSGSAKRKGDKWHWQNFPLSKLPPFTRYLESRLGEKWDKVWSDICRISNTYKPYNKQEFRVLFKNNVASNVTIVDGVVCEYTSWRGLQPVWHLSFYVHPETKILCQAPPKVKKIQKVDLHRKVVDNIVFEKLPHIYNVKVSCGVTKPITYYNWYKEVDVKYIGTVSYRELVFGPHYQYNWRTKETVVSDTWHWETKYREELLTRKKMIAASKKVIRKYKLNKE